ncbi:MAG TPA: helix-hairpin-helix domain-containing protein [Thermomicrobiaceae bacterium]|nr:helix-hairpin-helix domain-containing protein [Thermomicrobiaceae bacterium]
MQTSTVTNHEAALILLNIASILDATAGNPYRVRAYRRAARMLLRLRVPAAAFVTPDGELALPGLGERLRRKLGELFVRGEMQFYRDLYASLPPEMVCLMQVRGIGPRTALRLYVELGLASPGDVVAAARQARIRKLYRFGERSEARLAEAAAAVVASDDELPAAA